MLKPNCRLLLPFKTRRRDGEVDQEGFRIEEEEDNDNYEYYYSGEEEEEEAEPQTHLMK